MFKKEDVKKTDSVADHHDLTLHTSRNVQFYGKCMKKWSQQKI